MGGQIGQAGMFNMLQHKALATPNVVTITLNVFGSNLFVLINTRVTHFIISLKFVA